MERLVESEKFVVKTKNGKVDYLMVLYMHTMQQINKYKFIRKLKKRVNEYRDKRYAKAQLARKKMESDVKTFDSLVWLQ